MLRDSRLKSDDVAHHLHLQSHLEKKSWEFGEYLWEKPVASASVGKTRAAATRGAMKDGGFGMRDPNNSRQAVSSWESRVKLRKE